MAVDIPPQGETGHAEAELQRLATLALRGGAVGEDLITVRLCVSANDSAGHRFYDELLPISLVRAILSPSVANFFIPIKGSGSFKPPRTRGHFLHTSYIHEV